MKTILTAAIALFLAGTAGAADYLVYKDSSGGIVLSNFAPPDSAQIVARRAFTDVTAELARSELDDSWRRLVDEKISAFSPSPFVREWNQVAVSVGVPGMRRGFAHVRPMPR